LPAADGFGTHQGAYPPTRRRELSDDVLADRPGRAGHQDHCAAFVQCCDLPPVSLDPPVSDPAQTAVLCGQLVVR